MRNKGLIVGIVSILITILIASCANKTNTVENTQVDTVRLDNTINVNLDEAVEIGDGRSGMSFDTVNNSNTDLAKTTLSTIGLDEADIENFAVRIDPRLESAYIVGVFKVKDTDKVKNKLLEYIIYKQNALESVDETLYNIACNAVVANEEDYLFIGMREDADVFVNKMRNFVKIQLRGNSIGKRRIEDRRNVFNKDTTEFMRKIVDKSIADIEKERTYRSAMAALD